jgi:hypothetical protein
VAGGLSALSFIVAPFLFRSLPSRTQAANIFGRCMTAFGGVEVTAALLAAACAGFWFHERAAPGDGPRVALAAALLAVSILHHLWIFPVGRRLAGEIGNFDVEPADEAGRAQRARFRRLHRLSVAMMLVTLLLAVGLLGFDS